MTSSQRDVQWPSRWICSKKDSSSPLRCSSNEIKKQTHKSHNPIVQLASDSLPCPPFLNDSWHSYFTGSTFRIFRFWKPLVKMRKKQFAPFNDCHLCSYCGLYISQTSIPKCYFLFLSSTITRKENVLLLWLRQRRMQILCSLPQRLLQDLAMQSLLLWKSFCLGGKYSMQKHKCFKVKDHNFNYDQLRNYVIRGVHPKTVVQKSRSVMGTIFAKRKML